MKKTYLSPSSKETDMELELLGTASITGVGGDSGIEPGQGTPPAEADSRWKVWDDETGVEE